MRQVLTLVALLLPLQSVAAIYTCVGADGRKTYQETPCQGHGTPGVVRCIRPDGSSYVLQGDTCPKRVEPAERKPGMVLDITRGQQTFMVPGGGNGMIDPATGQRHELISPPPTRTVQDRAVPLPPESAGEIYTALSQDDLRKLMTRQRFCRHERDLVLLFLKSPQRTVTSLRYAEDRFRRSGCGPMPSTL